MTTTRIDRLLFTEEVAEMIRKSPSALRYMIHTGSAPRSAKIGGRRMFKESDVEAWIQEQFDKASA